MIIRDKKDLKITLPKYKITVKTINKNRNSYQYSCILPPLLVSFFNIQDNTNKEDPEDHRGNLLMFYEYENNNYIMSATTFYKAIHDSTQHRILEDINNMYGYEPKPEFLEYCENNPVNYEIYDRIRYNCSYDTTVYKLKNSNNYRVTLPAPKFKEQINPYKDNYICFVIDTQAEDLVYNKGNVMYSVIQETKQK